MVVICGQSESRTAGNYHYYTSEPACNVFKLSDQESVIKLPHSNPSPTVTSVFNDLKITYDSILTASENIIRYVKILGKIIRVFYEIPNFLSFFRFNRKFFKILIFFIFLI